MFLAHMSDTQNCIPQNFCKVRYLLQLTKIFISLLLSSGDRQGAADGRVHHGGHIEDMDKTSW